MKPMHIDFAPRSARHSLHQLHPALLAAGVVGALLCAGAALTGWKMAQQQREREHQIQHALERQAALSAAPVTVAKTAIPEAQAVFVNGAIMQLNLPWRALQDAVAAGTPKTVALVALEPDQRKQILKITAEAKSSDDMVGYVEELKQQELFSSVMLTRHEINEADPNRPLRFQLEAVWVAK
jgi:Tfp pilus assembly protein PilN